MSPSLLAIQGDGHKNLSPAPQVVGIAHKAEDVLKSAPFVSSHSQNRHVFEMFEQHPHVVGLPVVDDGVPKGLINRNVFMQNMARPFHREVYLKKTCKAFMDEKPMVVEASLGMQDLSFQVVSGGAKTLADGFIITRDGEYAGVGMAGDVFESIAALQAEKSRQVMESIEYARVIQHSLSRSSREGMRHCLPDHFLLWEPRDVVSGDFYFFHEYQDGWLLSLFDCTGHGVPGAFMTLIMSSFMQAAVADGRHRNPAGLLSDMNRRVKLAMGQVDHSHSDGDGEHASDDGMDAAFCWFDKSKRQLTYAGAHMPLFLLTPNAPEVLIQDGNRHGVGYATTAMDQVWQNFQFEVPVGTRLFIFSDGFLDQLGGKRRIAFGKKRLCKTLLDMSAENMEMPKQRNHLLSVLHEYQGNESRRDDVSAVGIHFCEELLK